jgi:hypothetical protein
MARWPSPKPLEAEQAVATPTARSRIELNRYRQNVARCP